ncbi:hypothetical protein I5I70_29245, partial [Pseudomonas aeruginosa]|nr:hypothetical protein [Pseudomonas aeruginosa]
PRGAGGGRPPPPPPRAGARAGARGGARPTPRRPGPNAASLLASQARGIEWVTALSALLALFGAALALRLRREEPAALQPSRG